MPEGLTFKKHANHAVVLPSFGVSRIIHLPKFMGSNWEKGYGKLKMVKMSMLVPVLKFFENIYSPEADKVIILPIDFLHKETCQQV